MNQSALQANQKPRKHHSGCHADSCNCTNNSFLSARRNVYLLISLLWQSHHVSTPWHLQLKQKWGKHAGISQWLNICGYVTVVPRQASTVCFFPNKCSCLIKICSWLFVSGHVWREPFWRNLYYLLIELDWLSGVRKVSPLCRCRQQRWSDSDYFYLVPKWGKTPRHYMQLYFCYNISCNWNLPPIYFQEWDKHRLWD